MKEIDQRMKEKGVSEINKVSTTQLLFPFTYIIGAIGLCWSANILPASAPTPERRKKKEKEDGNSVSDLYNTRKIALPLERRRSEDCDS